VGASFTPGSLVSTHEVRGGSRVMAGVFGSWLLTHYRRKRMNHRFRRLSLTKPHQKFTFVHPSDLPLARRTWMVQAPLGLHPSAFARFVTWRLQGSGTWLDTSQEHDWWSCSLKLEQHRVAGRVDRGCRHPRPPSDPYVRLSTHTAQASHSLRDSEDPCSPRDAPSPVGDDPASRLRPLGPFARLSLRI